MWKNVVVLLKWGKSYPILRYVWYTQYSNDRLTNESIYIQVLQYKSSIVTQAQWITNLVCLQVSTLSIWVCKTHWPISCEGQKDWVHISHHNNTCTSKRLMPVFSRAIDIQYKWTIKKKHQWKRWETSNYQLHLYYNTVSVNIELHTLLRNSVMELYRWLGKKGKGMISDLLPSPASPKLSLLSPVSPTEPSPIISSVYYPSLSLFCYLPEWHVTLFYFHLSENQFTDSFPLRTYQPVSVITSQGNRLSVG